jgi:hypothetical protein
MKLMGLATGTLEIDILKSVTDLNILLLLSIFDVKPSINLSTASDYAKSALIKYLATAGSFGYW